MVSSVVIPDFIEQASVRGPPCSYCSKFFSTSSNLERHLRTAHNVQSRRKIKMDLKGFHHCGEAQHPKYLHWQRFQKHMATAHFIKEFKPKRRVLCALPPKTLQNNSNKICFSGNWEGRMFWGCMMRELGFEVLH